ncbi:peptidyl-alpha-hydroxyglycine alpha-amidating lyase family protein [Candidatus Palauibacter sp.]|uniref:peptidyl-alpha-hydroxyglycine alpha-amidating lyase family protein n=1 Tax=Candidatus Palauibacter sp. TaxID=3101350 RepID=UPI003AF21DD4
MTRFKRTFAAIVIGAVTSIVAVVAACEPGPDTAPGSDSAPAVEPLNDLPNPYERIEPWAELPPGAVQWGQVTGVEQGPDGNLYVMHRCFEGACADRPEDPIVKYDMSGRPLASWGAGLFNYPHGFHVDFEGNVWATDARGNGELGHQVFKFSPDGELLLTLGQAGVGGLGPDVFNQPTDVLVLPGGDILVTEGHGDGNDRVVRFNSEGDFLESWGEPGSGPGQFRTPHAIARDSQGRIFIGDRANNRIQIFLEDGTFLEEWKQFSRPSGIFIDEDDTIYVADSESWGPDNPGWKKGIRIGSARDGSVSWFIEDIESMTDPHSGAEAVGVDSEGNVYGGVVRRRMLEKHVPVR